MKTALYAAVAALALALAPLANAAEGNGEPFPFSAGPIATTHFTNGVADQAAAPRDVGTEAEMDTASPIQGQPVGPAYGTTDQHGALHR